MFKKFVTISAAALLIGATAVAAGNGNAFGKDKGARGNQNDASGLAVSGANGRVDSGWGNGGENTGHNTPNSGGEGAAGDNDNGHGNSGH